MDEIRIGKSELDILKQKKAEHLSAAAALDAAIRVLEGNADKPIDWKNSARDCLIQHGFPMRTVDILNCMAEKDPDKYKLDEYNKRRNYMNALSIALNSMCDKDILERIQIPGFKGYFYGLRLWFMGAAISPDVNSLLMYELWTNKNSIFNMSKLESDLVDDDEDDE